jgi:hypothetical protein
MRKAAEPFQFVTASYLIRVCRERARTIGELLQSVASCSSASIFYHTFQSLEAHHYSTFSSDFAQWAMSACNDAMLAERLVGVDVRNYVSIEDLRKELVRRLEEHVKERPGSGSRPAFEAFYFCESVEKTVSRDEQATTLGELMEGIERISVQTLHHHFINSRLRLKLQTNDFSHWVRVNLELPQLADALNRIDIYTNTLEKIRMEVLEAIEPWIGL